MALVGQRYLMAIGGNDGKPLHDLLSTSFVHDIDRTQNENEEVEEEENFVLRFDGS